MNTVRDIASASGFEITDTGGGIEQLLRAMPDGSYVIITSVDGEVPTSPEDPCVVGAYSPEGEQVKIEEKPSLEAAIHAVL